MAYYLASQENPQAKLCPHKPAIMPEELDMDSEEMIEIIKGTGIPKEKLMFYLENRESSTSRVSGDGSHQPVEPGAVVEQDMALTPKQFWTQYHGLTPKDRKSFTQMLYRTVAARFFEWATLQRPAQTYQKALNSANGVSQPAAEDPGQHRPEQQLQLTLTDSLRKDPRPTLTNQHSSRDTNEEKGLTNGSTSSEYINGDTEKAQDRNPPRGLAPRRRPSISTPAQAMLKRSEPTKRLRNTNGLVIDTGKDKLEERKPSYVGTGHDWIGMDGLQKPIPGSDTELPDKFRPQNSRFNSYIVPNEEPRHPRISDIQLSGQKRQDSATEQQVKAKEEPPAPEKLWDGLPVLSQLDCSVMHELIALYCEASSKSPTLRMLHLSPDRLLGTATSGATLDLDNPAIAFVYRSLAYTLSSPAALLRSFREDGWKRARESPLPHLHPSRIDDAFRSLALADASVVFDSLWRGLEPLFTPPPQLTARKARVPGKKGRNASSTMPTTAPVYYSDEEAAHIIMICIHALTAFVTTCPFQTMKFVRTSRSWGEIYPPHFSISEHPFRRPMLSVIDELEYEPAIRLANRLVRAIAARRSHHEILKAIRPEGKGKAPMASCPSSQTSKFPLMDIIIRHLIEIERSRARHLKPPSLERALADFEEGAAGTDIPYVLLEWLRTIILKEWDMSPSLKRWDAVGAAFELMSDLYEHREALEVEDDAFELPLVLDAFEPDQLPFDFMNRAKNPNYVHILSFPFLFRRTALVAYFRAINYANMIDAYGNVQFDQQLERRLDWARSVLTRAKGQNRLKHHQRFLLLEVRREFVLEDTFNQLWRRERQELLRPFKVRISSKEGEQGVDQGGVSQEFFRIALAQALDPDAGMFSVDPVTRMTWFRPASLAPIYQFELVGLIISIAVFNGITLPLTFPLALYRKLLDKRVSTMEDIRDGWPDLVKGFEELLRWSDGDVEDIFVREYAFDVDLHGKHTSIDMKAFGPDDKWTVENSDNGPTAESSKRIPTKEFDMVTNANRTEFVHDYIAWLTNRSIEAQFDAFARGFYACLDRKALSVSRYR